MTQLVELQEALPKFAEANIKVYAISYDEVGAQADFADNHGTTFELLADVGSKVIRQFGILNTSVSEHEVPYYGIPFPGTYLVDESGVVTAKFFHRGLAQRSSAEAVLDAASGTILLQPDDPTVGLSDDSGIEFSLSYHGGGGVIRGGAMRELVVRATLPDGLHLYDDPVPEGMVATAITMAGPNGLRSLPLKKPPTETLNLPGIGELRVWTGQVDFVLPVWATDDIASLLRNDHPDRVTIEVEISYQACTDTDCLLPRTERLTLDVPVGDFTAPTAAGVPMLGSVTTTMDTQKWMQSMVRRSLDAAPDRAAAKAFLTETMNALQAGPMGAQLDEEQKSQ
ncbi:MAG: peroxiredoxin [Acidimicrobiales bacterium]|jgi:peroxiredoxin